MSQDFTHVYYRQSSFSGDDHPQLPYSAASSSPIYAAADHDAHRSLHINHQMFDPSRTFTEFLIGSPPQNSFDSDSFISSTPTASDQIIAPAAVGRGEAPATPNSSISTSSNEATARDDDSGKGKKNLGDAAEGDSSKKDGKLKKTKPAEAIKKEKQPRFAFMTKSEVDHLEDGYRWRKYGQKAVKNSPYPRSYYRCTTQKCPVKKRVERSFHDPSNVVTTYEGQHNHHPPVNLRGNAGSMLAFPPPPMMLTQPQPPPLPASEGPVGFPHVYSFGPSDGTGNNLSSNSHHFQYPDFGLLQDIIPHAFPKQEP